MGLTTADAVHNSEARVLCNPLAVVHGVLHAKNKLLHKDPWQRMLKERERNRAVELELEKERLLLPQVPALASSEALSARVRGSGTLNSSVLCMMPIRLG